MFGNNVKYKDLEGLEKRLDNHFERLNEANQKIRKLEYQLSYPAKYKTGQKLFKRYTICEVHLAWEVEYPCSYYGWKYKAFDSKLNMIVTMRLDCGGNIIEF